jgi:hypothetical protein
MAYTAFDVSKPAIADSRTNVVAYARTNGAALLHMVLSGGAGNLAWAFSKTGTTKPTEMLLSNGTERIRWTLTWGGTGSNYITAITSAYSSNSGGAYDTIGTFTFTYTSDELSGGNVGSLALASLVWQIGRTLDVIGDLSTHAALTGTSAHGLGTISTQAASSVAITGGTINGTSFGASTAAAVNTTRLTESMNTYTPGSGAGVTVDWANGSSIITNSGTNVLTFSNVPTTGRTAYHRIYTSNFNSSTFPAAVTWGVSGKPSINGGVWADLWTRDGGTTVYGAVLWRSV